MPGKTTYPGHPRENNAYCEGRAFAVASGTIVFGSGTTGSEGSNHGLTWTAKVFGEGAVSVELVDPGAVSQSLAVSVVGTNVIRVSLETDGNGDLASTATEVEAAVEAHSAANALVTVNDTGASTGAGVCPAASIVLTGSSPVLPAGPDATAFQAGFASHSANPAGWEQERDNCADAPGQGYA